MSNLGLPALPLIDRLGARRIEKAIAVDTAGGALISVMLVPPLLFLARLVAAVFRSTWGFPWGLIGWAIGWLIAGYVALVLLANWRSLDNKT